MNSTKDILISVCLPTFNGALHLKKALASITNQTYKNIEVIISDDNSTDSTLIIANEFKSKMTFPVFIYNHAPQGIGANWNNCIEKSNGKYVKFIFQDDFMEPTCLDEMLLEIELTKKKICVCKRNLIIDDYYKNDNSIKNWTIVYGDLQKDIILTEKDGHKFITSSIFSERLFLTSPYNKIGEPIVGLVDKAVFEEVGLYSTSLRQILDYEFWYRALKKYDFAFLEKKLVNFRVHFSQATRQNQRNKIRETPLYLTFIEINFYKILHPKAKRKWFGYIPRFKRKIKSILKRKKIS